MRRWALVAAALLLAGPATAGPLDAFHAALERRAQGAAERVRIVQIGDSHTAGAFFTDRLRERLQERLGDSGPGVLAAGRPPGTRPPAGVDIRLSDGWTYARATRDGGPYGLTSVRSSVPADGWARLRVEDGVGQLLLEIVGRPGGGDVLVRADGAEIARVVTDTALPSHILAPVVLPGRTTEVTLGIERGPVTFLSWSLEARRPGVVVDQVGLDGARLATSEHWSRTAAARMLSIRRPRLVVVAYGTNDAVGDRDPAGHAERARALIRRLREGAPDAAVLLLGPPPTRAARVNGLDAVRQALGAVAESEGAAFWDWAGQAGEVEIAPDGVHLTPAGYRASADRLVAWLWQRHIAWRRGPG
jgi:hypothetical protein